MLRTVAAALVIAFWTASSIPIVDDPTNSTSLYTCSLIRFLRFGAGRSGARSWGLPASIGALAVNDDGMVGLLYMLWRGRASRWAMVTGHRHAWRRSPSIRRRFGCSGHSPGYTGSPSLLRV